MPDLIPAGRAGPEPGAIHTRQGNTTSFTGTPDERLAAITRDQWQNFLDFYRPIEDEVLRSAMQTDFTAEGDKAGATAASAANASKGSLARTLSRAGTSLSAEESAAVNRRHASSLTRSVAQAENTTRRGMSDSRTNLLAGMVGVGRGVSDSATSGLTTSANLSTARQAQLDRQSAQAHNTNVSGGATLAAAIIAMY
jgi:hypothetical protein